MSDTPRTDAAELDMADLTDEGFGPSGMCRRDAMESLERELTAAKARIAELEAANEWRPIESAPKDGTEINLYSPPCIYEGKPIKERFTQGYWFKYEKNDFRCESDDDALYNPYWFSDDGGFTEDYPPTHWRPLPKPPTNEVQL